MRVFSVAGPSYRDDGVQYQGLSVVNSADWRQYMFHEGARVLGYFDGRPAPWPWNGIDLQLSTRDDWGDRAPADLLAFRSGLIGLSPSMANELDPILGDGELLPAAINGTETIRLFHCRNPLNAFDANSSTALLPIGRPMALNHVERWAFRPDEIGDSAFFRDPTFGSALFATDRAVSMLTSSGLVGLNIREIWNDVGEPPEHSRYPWEGITFGSVGEIIAYEEAHALPAEQFDETLYSLLASHHRPGFPIELARPVSAYFAQRVVQYKVVTGGLQEALTEPHLIVTAAASYRSWGRPDAADALEEALRLVPDLIHAVEREEFTDYNAMIDAIAGRCKRYPLIDEEFRSLAQRVPHESWSANPERLNHVRRYRSDFLQYI